MSDGDADSDLAVRLARPDHAKGTEWFVDLADQIRPTLVAVASLITCADPAATVESLRSGLRAAWSDRGTAPQPADRPGWLTGLVARAAMAAAGPAESSAEPAGPSAEAAEAAEPPDRPLDPAEPAGSTEHLVHRVLRAEPPQVRAVLALAEHARLAPAAMGQALLIPEPQVRLYLARGRRVLATARR